MFFVFFFLWKLMFADNLIVHVWIGNMCSLSMYLKSCIIKSLNTIVIVVVFNTVYKCAILFYAWVGHLHLLLLLLHLLLLLYLLLCLNKIYITWCFLYLQNFMCTMYDMSTNDPVVNKIWNVVCSMYSFICQLKALICV